MKSKEQIQNRMDTLNEVIAFALLIKLDTIAIANLKSFIKILEWVISDDG